MAGPSIARWRGIEPPQFTNTDCAHDDLQALFFAPDPDEREDGTKAIEGRAVARRREHEARLVCAECPFIVACALHGLEHEDYGIWGALSEQDRSALGGRGIGPAGLKSPERVAYRLKRAGVDEDKIAAIVTLWRARQAQLEAEEQAREDEVVRVGWFGGEGVA